MNDHVRAAFRADPRLTACLFGRLLNICGCSTAVLAFQSSWSVRRLPRKNDNLFSSHSSQLISAVQICPAWTCNLWKFPTSWLICKHTHFSQGKRGYILSATSWFIDLLRVFLFLFHTHTFFWLLQKTEHVVMDGFPFHRNNLHPLYQSCKQNESESIIKSYQICFDRGLLLMSLNCCFWVWLQTLLWIWMTPQIMWFMEERCVITF